MLPQSYSNFTFDNLEELKIQFEERKLFPQPVGQLEPSDWLKKTLEITLDLPLATEKSKSEHIVVPILNDLRTRNDHFFTYYSGYNFDVNKDLGLKGHCDFLVSLSPKLPIIKNPVLAIVEAKNADIDSGLAQCIAQLYAALLFNQKHKFPFEFTYGAVTTGFDWKFIRFENNLATIDSDLYQFSQLPLLLGILQYVIDEFKNIHATAHLSES